MRALLVGIAFVVALAACLGPRTGTEADTRFLNLGPDDALYKTLVAQLYSQDRGVILTALHAPLSFFNQTDAGVTLSRFGQDLQAVDSELPLATLNIACSGLILAGQMALIAGASRWLVLALATEIGLLALFFLQRDLGPALVLSCVFLSLSLPPLHSALHASVPRAEGS